MYFFLIQQNLNFLNLDIQGMELKAMKSMGDHISKLDFIYTEVNTEYVYKNCALLKEIDEYLSKYGFKRVAIKMCGNYGWGDAFYIKQNISLLKPKPYYYFLLH